ncbi:MAG: hypothetical protein INH41_16050 [Myxococcaceae bacterium]|jgi:hypothetical protein|nr:hypothetical protein [Myxococcaceae bacterium]
MNHRLLPCALVVLFTSTALANGRPDCQRNCATTLKAFEKQCKEQEKTNPKAKQGCDMVKKQFQLTCQQACESGGKMKKPSTF